MSLNASELERTSAELARNLELAGIPDTEVAADLGFTVTQLRELVRLASGQDPADVWLLRDYLEQAILDAGGMPEPFTVLTERARGTAQRWFTLRTAPHHEPAERQ